MATDEKRTTEAAGASRLPAGAIDAHVHLMPEELLGAIREALAAQGGWAFDHPAQQAGIESVLREAGVERYLALPYAHRPGMAAELNEWVLRAASGSNMCTPFATVHAEDDVARVVRSAFEAGARGLKFQCPVQKCGPDDPRLDPAFELASDYDRPIVFHAGTAPMFEDSPHVGSESFESFLESYPDVRACGAHMGTYEVEAFRELVREHENAFLDTTMALSPRSPQYMDFDPATIADDTIEELSESIMYGSDFPNLPYSYAEERVGLLDRELSAETYRDLFVETATRFLGEQ
ncbi:amidohydrolase [Halobacteriales archaeon QS_3_64_16]|nr:MAG: amidohydrolase [Halobacteriales archaeon QS_3_64_16]